MIPGLRGKRLTSDHLNCDLAPHTLSYNMDSYHLHYSTSNQLSYECNCVSLGTESNCRCYSMSFNHLCYDINTLSHLITFYKIMLKRLTRLKCTVLFNFQMQEKQTRHTSILATTATLQRYPATAKGRHGDVPPSQEGTQREERYGSTHS
jgi:hypothetical protein